MGLLGCAETGHGDTNSPATWIVEGVGETAPLEPVLWKPADLEQVKQRVAAQDPELAAAVAALVEHAERAAAAPPPSVVQNRAVPPSRDMHDYFSIGVYWHELADGGWERRDGELNPLSGDPTFDDSALLDQFVEDFSALALAAYLTDEPRYAEAAAAYVRTWFLDPETGMSPHLRYGSSNGMNGGRPQGIVRTKVLIDVWNYLPLIRGSAYWTAEDQRGLETWFRRYRQWLLHDPFGRHQFNADNNHGIWYDAQVIAYSYHLGEPETARNFLRHLKARIGTQITPAGWQPQEIERPRSYFYSCYTLEGFFVGAHYAEALGMDLWTYRTREGSGLEPALDLISRHVYRETDWPHEEMDSFERSRGQVVSLLFQGVRIYGPAQYSSRLEDLAAELGDDRVARSRDQLIYPLELPARRAAMDGPDADTTKN